MDFIVCMWGVFWNMLFCLVSGVEGYRQSMLYELVYFRDIFIFFFLCMYYWGRSFGLVFIIVVVQSYEFFLFVVDFLQGGFFLFIFFFKLQFIGYGFGWFF